jgi:hypothetical protein
MDIGEVITGLRRYPLLPMAPPIVAVDACAVGPPTTCTTNTWARASPPPVYSP